MLKRCARFLVPIGLVMLLVPSAASSVAAQTPGMEQRVARLERQLAGIQMGDQMTIGREIYKAACMACHGINGDGNGPSAKWLDPKPRDFTKGLYKWRTTPYGALPTDADLERVIRDGVSGSEMVPFGQILSKRSRLAVVQYIKSFSPRFADPAEQPSPESIVKVPSKRPFESSEDSIAKGQAVFAAKGCTACHGTDGDGQGPAADSLVDAWGNAVRPWNFELGYYKSGSTDQDLFLAITTGLNGTPMAAFSQATTETERWQLVDYIRSLSESRSRLLRYLLTDEPTGRIYERPKSPTN